MRQWPTKVSGGNVHNAQSAAMLPWHGYPTSYFYNDTALWSTDIGPEVPDQVFAFTTQLLYTQGSQALDSQQNQRFVHQNHQSLHSNILSSFPNLHRIPLQTFHPMIIHHASTLWVLCLTWHSIPFQIIHLVIIHQTRTWLALPYPPPTARCTDEPGKNVRISNNGLAHQKPHNHGLLGYI